MILSAQAAKQSVPPAQLIFEVDNLPEVNLALQIQQLHKGLKQI